LNLITNCVRMKHFGVNLLSQIKSEYINLEWFLMLVFVKW
jgi:hypothetical protein